MKKLTVLFSTFAICTLLFFVSCTKEKNILITHEADYIPSGIMDTPYLSNNSFVDDTPYVKRNVIQVGFADTPYLGNHSFADTPYLGKTRVIKSR